MDIDQLAEALIGDVRGFVRREVAQVTKQEVERAAKEEVGRVAREEEERRTRILDDEMRRAFKEADAIQALAHERYMELWNRFQEALDRIESVEQRVAALQEPVRET